EACMPTPASPFARKGPPQNVRPSAISPEQRKGRRVGDYLSENPWFWIYLLYFSVLLVVLIWDFQDRPWPPSGSSRSPEGMNASAEEPPPIESDNCLSWSPSLSNRPMDPIFEPLPGACRLQAPVTALPEPSYHLLQHSAERMQRRAVAPTLAAH